MSHVTESNPIAWTQTSGTATDYALTLPPGSFPLVDKSFFAGCRKSASNNDECVVQVSVKARTSTVNDGVLTCAYGTDSNKSVPEVTLNSENNSLTIHCGDEGQMEPPQQSMTPYHCVGSNTDECRIVNLTEIMPAFASSWWTTDTNDGDAPKLVIPEEGFPVLGGTIVLGCNQKNTGGSRDEPGGQATAAALPTCRVKVTLGANTSGSHAPNVSFHRFFGLVSVPLVLFATY
ncbi:srs domain-containing protein [Neospora caninum Liverpool]|uniref:Srs domain-containing protein n=1 Tax=Neospora caninum (strain Liverpool) TaxID=572307 RepID=F0VAR2_NEOCL|nr:srs domain-containing protein [Neospora caninum Liverpool]CBZ51320.1 srs domain-containing protein [Neospora caninum Liverpool]CEL68635.1 TPA: SRS domain-containing protein [Neospora caninum Liverpool]|eukprot:XP_003881353.1 srs domain-containing protein [Neospora caninum Liverpool]